MQHNVRSRVSPWTALCVKAEACCPEACQAMCSCSKAGEAKRYVHQHAGERGKLVKVRSKAPSVRKQQVKDSGGQKVSKRKMNKNSTAKDFVFVYSLGDEMNKWSRPSQLHKFRDVR